jgi:hypothetical protein
MFCPIQHGRTRPKLAGQIAEQTASRTEWPIPIYTIPWECLCVDLIGPYTLKGKDNLQIDFMALTMINLASSWFEIAELPIVKQLC